MKPSQLFRKSVFPSQHVSLDMKEPPKKHKKKRLGSASVVEIHSARATQPANPPTHLINEIADAKYLLSKKVDNNKLKSLFGKLDSRSRAPTEEFIRGYTEGCYAGAKLASQLDIKHKASFRESSKGSQGKLSFKNLGKEGNKRETILKKLIGQRVSTTSHKGGIIDGTEKTRNKSHKRNLPVHPLTHLTTRKKESREKTKKASVGSKNEPLKAIQTEKRNRFIQATNRSLQGQSISKEVTNETNDLEDIGFLFNQNLSNVEKMNLLKLRNNQIDKTNKHQLEMKPSEELPRETFAGDSQSFTNQHFLRCIQESKVHRAERLETNQQDFRTGLANPAQKELLKSFKDQANMESNDIEIEEDFQEALMTSKRDDKPKDQQTSRKIIDFYPSNPLLKSKVTPARETDPHNRACLSPLPESGEPKEFGKMFQRKMSFEAPNPLSSALPSLSLSLAHLTSTSLLSEKPPFFQPSEASSREADYAGGSLMHRQNSDLLLQSLISSVDMQRTDRSSVAAQVENERLKLISYIKKYCEVNQKVPRTTLQFFKVLKLVGKGSFGKVHLAIQLLTKKKVAIKTIDKQYIIEEKAQNKILQEVTILKSLSHKNIVKILEVFENSKYIFIVTDYACRGDLLQYMKANGVFKEHKAKPVVAGILNGLEYCHSRGVLHRDIKLDNILLGKHMKVKICDFGVSRRMPTGNREIKERCGTPAYIAPEIIKNQGYSNFGADVAISDLDLESGNCDLRHDDWNNSLQSQNDSRASQTNKRIRFHFPRRLISF